jgi:hypothetical protein
MIRKLNCTDRKDVTQHVELTPDATHGYLRVTVRIKESVRRIIPGCDNLAVFVRCSDRQRAETVREIDARRLLKGPITYEFKEFTTDHEPKVQVRLVDASTKLIVGATKEKDLPGSGESQGRHSLLPVRAEPELKHELYRIDWREERAFFKYNPNHPDVKTLLLKDQRISPVVKPQILRLILTQILSLRLHMDGEERQRCAEKWLALCKRQGWNISPPPSGGSETYTLNLDWINSAVDGYARQLGLPGKWETGT